MCLLYWWNPTLVTLSIIGRVPKTELQTYEVSAFSLVPPAAGVAHFLNVPFGFQGHPWWGLSTMETTALEPTWDKLRDFPEEISWILRIWLASVSRCLKWRPLVIQLTRGRGCMTATCSQIVLFVYMTMNQHFSCKESLNLVWNTGVKKTFSFKHCQPCL